MRRTLVLHPRSGDSPASRIEVEVGRPRPRGLALTYVVTGKIGDLVIPPVEAPARTDDLWRHTCFEAFIRPPREKTYFEFNVAPSSRWAAYRFNEYRAGMSVARKVPTPLIEVRTGKARFELRVLLNLNGLPELPGDETWRLGLSAVIEEADERKSYWALAHPAGKPDFHHPDGFSYDLAPMERA